LSTYTYGVAGPNVIAAATLIQTPCERSRTDATANAATPQSEADKALADLKRLFGDSDN